MGVKQHETEVRDAAADYAPHAVKPKVPEGYKQTEVGVIPKEWEIAYIHSLITDISMGPFGSDIKVSNFVSSGVPVLSGANVAAERLVDSFTNFLTPRKAKSLKKAVARRGDIVVTHRGTLGQIAYIPEDSEYERYVISQSQFRARFSEKKVIPEWIVLFFHSSKGAAYLLEGKGHTGVPAISQPTKTFRGILVPLPPIHEQRAISTALSDMDALLEGLDRLISKKRDLKEAAMQQLLTGQTRLPGFEGEWKTKRLGEIAEIQRGASPRPIDSPVWFDQSSNVGWVRISDVTRSGVYLYETDQRLSQLGVNHSRPVETDSLIMSICATVGRPVITKIDVCIHDGFVVFDHLEADQLFAYYVLKWIEPDWSKHGQTGSQMNLNTGLIKGTAINLPPRKEQTAIATVLSDTDLELDALEQRRAKTAALKQAMMQELLTGRTRLVEPHREEAARA